MVANAGEWSDLFDEIGIGLAVLVALFVLGSFVARARSLFGLALNGPIAVILFSHAANSDNLRLVGLFSPCRLWINRGGVRSLLPRDLVHW